MAHSTLFLTIAIFLLQYNALCFSLSVPNDEVGEPVPPSTMLSKIGRLVPQNLYDVDNQENEKEIINDFLRGMIFKRSNGDYNPNGSLTPFVRLGKQQLPARISSRSKVTSASEPVDRNGISWNYLRQHLMKRGHTLSSIRL